MKTTSYKISKQLAEVGFNKYKIPATEYCWHHDNFGSTRFLVGAELEDKTTQTLVSEYKIYPAYDLETILEALPKNIITYPDEKITEQPIEKLRLEMDEIGYYFSDKDDYGRDNCFTYFHREESESLADCAAKMWLKLKKDNLI